MRKIFGLALAMLCSANLFAEGGHYLVGGCTDSGWNTNTYNRSAVRAYTSDGTTWVWVGKLTVGEGDDGRFKIPNSDGGWDGYWAPSQGYVLTSEWADLSDNGAGDNKYCVAEEGLYKITFNTDEKKIKADKLTAPVAKDGYFEIGSLEDYYAVAAYIATDATKASNIRLTADLSFEGETFVPLASDKHKFKGEFDGQNHVIDYAVLNCPYTNVGLFTFLADGANVHNLAIGANSSFTGLAKVGGFAGSLQDGGEVKLTNAVNMARIHSTGNTDANAAGLVGCPQGATKLTAKNCANMGAISGQDGQCAAFVGWAQGGTTFTNCWNVAEINNTEGDRNLYRSNDVTLINCYNVTTKGNQGTKVDAALLGTGEFCYLLNGDQSEIAWYQTLEDDACPVPFSTHAQVYANGELKCDGTSAGGALTYSNSSTSVVPPHTDVDGWCSVCNAFMPNHLSAVDGFYSIATAKELNWFAVYVNTVNGRASAKLTADIDYTDYKQGFIGNSSGTPFRGTFDGQNHTVTIDIVNAGTDRTGLFAYINAATIKNLVVEGSATSNDRNCVGGLGGRSDGNGTLVENVIVKANVSYTGSNGDATCGGFFANMENSVTLKNCAFLGSINSGNAEGNGGLVGWSGGGSNNNYINCLVAPTSYTKNGNSADFARNNPTCTNCYAVEAADPRLASGELCYKLGGAFRQTIGTDAHPVFSAESGIVNHISAAGYATQYVAGTDVTVPAAVKAYTATVEDGALVLNELEGAIASEEAVILEGAEGYYSFVPTTGAAKASQNDLVGVTEDTEAPVGSYVMQKQNDKVGFYLVEDVQPVVKAGRAYLAANSQVKAFFLDQVATGIQNVDAELAQQVIYDLNGRRVSKAVKGLYIVNGKKVLK